MEPLPPRPPGYNTINPFVVVTDARDFIRFVEEAFGGIETVEARTEDDDGLLIHAEVVLGDSPLLLFDRKPGWKHTPAFLQVYVTDVEEALTNATGAGATILTSPSDFYGDILARVQDRWGNIWWLYQHVGEPDWTAVDENSATAEKDFVYHSIIEAMTHLRSVD